MEKPKLRLLGSLAILEGFPHHFLERLCSILSYEETQRTRTGFTQTLNYKIGSQLVDGSWAYPVRCWTYIKYCLRMIQPHLEYEVVDQRRFQYGTPLNNSFEFIKGLEPWEFHQEGVRKGFSLGHGVFHVATGCGKSRIGLNLCYNAYKATNKPVMWLCSMKNALEDFSLQEAYSQACATVGGEGWIEFLTRSKVGLDIKNGNFDPGAWGGILIDECHDAASPQYRAILDEPIPFAFGMTGTMIRNDGKEIVIHAFLGPSVYKFPREKGIEVGVITDVKVLRHKLSWPESTKVDDETFRRRKGNLEWIDSLDMNKHLVETYIDQNEERCSYIANLVKKLVDRGGQVIVLYDRVATMHGTMLTDKIAEAIGPELVENCNGSTGTAKYRNSVALQFKYGQLRCLVTTLAYRSVDYTMTTDVILSGGVVSESDCIQAAGRACRTHAGKAHSYLHLIHDEGHNMLSSKGRRAANSFRQEGFEVIDFKDSLLGQHTMEFEDA